MILFTLAKPQKPSAWRAVKGAGIAVATAAANIDLNLESLEGGASANKSFS